MATLDAVNLIQAATVSTCLLGAILLWQKSAFRGASLLLLLIALASMINILEEAGVTRDVYLISPIFVMLFGPAIYLATRHLLQAKLDPKQWLHFLPVVPMLFFTSQVQVIIAIGTLWRIAYAFLTARALLQYKQRISEQRSDSHDFSFSWLLGVVVLTAAFNLLDLMRLNTQQWLSVDINTLGQGVNNFVWLVVVMLITIKLNEQRKPPALDDTSLIETQNNPAEKEDFRATFNEIERLMSTQRWYLKPRLTLTEMSQLSGFQPRDISRAINLLAGVSFNEYINQYRINLVCQQIDLGSKKSLLQIAMDAGFSSKASFNLVFKALKGQTPSEYKAAQESTKT